MSPEKNQANSSVPRALTVPELGILRVMLAGEFPGRDALKRQLDTAMVSIIDENGSLGFHVNGAAVAEVVRRVAVAAETRDADGITVHVLLHVVDGLLNELEIYREDSHPLQREIDLEQLRVLDF